MYIEGVQKNIQPELTSYTILQATVGMKKYNRTNYTIDNFSS